MERERAQEEIRGDFELVRTLVSHPTKRHEATHKRGKRGNQRSIINQTVKIVTDIFLFLLHIRKKAEPMHAGIIVLLGSCSPLSGQLYKSGEISYPKAERLLCGGSYCGEMIKRCSCGEGTMPR